MHVLIIYTLPIPTVGLLKGDSFHRDSWISTWISTKAIPVDIHGYPWIST